MNNNKIAAAVYHDENEIENLVSVNDGLKKELEMIVATIETQYNKMKEERRKDIEVLKQRVDDDEEVRTKELQLKRCQAKVNKFEKVTVRFNSQ